MNAPRSRHKFDDVGFAGTDISISPTRCASIIASRAHSIPIARVGATVLSN
jgi:hypothetical protein